MIESSLNSRSTTGTRTRVQDVCYSSGMCPICIRECKVLCEIGKSAFRGREVLYPLPEQFGSSTQSSNKKYGLDWSDFQIMAELLGAKGIEADSEKAIFPNVDIKTSVGGVPIKIPVFTAALGSTAVAKKNWRELAIGAAISGTIQVVGENVSAMDPDAVFTDGKVTHSKDLKYRVETFREFWDGRYGDIAIQTNVEDQRAGQDVYALSKLEVNIIERKWGQGAKSIGGEVRLPSIERALLLKKRGYIVIPDPEDPSVKEAFKMGTFNTFERHSRVGMPSKRGFIDDMEWLRKQGAEKIFLKTGAYRPEAVAFTMKVASETHLDAVTFDGAGGGTGMSPVPMMQESATPTVFLAVQVLKCAEILRKHGKHVPDLVIAGGFINETQIFKAIAMSNFGQSPYFKAVAMARAPITTVFKAGYFKELAESGELPTSFKSLYGEQPETFFVCSSDLRNKYKDQFSKIPAGAIGLYTYYVDRIGTGLRELMAGARVWKLNLLKRANIAALTERANKVTSIPLIEDIGITSLETILLD